MQSWWQLDHAGHSGFAPENFTTFAHFSPSSTGHVSTASDAGRCHVDPARMGMGDEFGKAARWTNLAKPTVVNRDPRSTRRRTRSATSANLLILPLGIRRLDESLSQQRSGPWGANELDELACGFGRLRGRQQSNCRDARLVSQSTWRSAVSSCTSRPC
jgi:hypothetical protein